jgi:Domain of unknown function (DUF4158)
VATRVFSDEELERLRSFPDISREELIRFFTLTPADVAFIDPGRGRGPADRLGLAVQLCTLPWLVPPLWVNPVTSTNVHHGTGRVLGHRCSTGPLPAEAGGSVSCPPGFVGTAKAWVTTPVRWRSRVLVPASDRPPSTISPVNLAWRGAVRR